MRNISAILLAILLSLACAAGARCEVEYTWPRTITVTVGGDCTIGCLDEQSKSKRGFKHIIEEKGFDWPFSGLLSLLSGDDLSLMNLEGPFTTSGDKVKKKYNFRAPPSYVEILSRGSIEAVNLANNHTFDYGEQGALDTQSALDGAGIIHSGNGELGILETRGVRIGMTGYAYPFKDGRQDITADVQALRDAGCQIVIASFHWGSEYQYKQSSEQSRIGRAAIDAGADLVVGHHPHVIQGIEQYNGRYILYSLGNLVFGGNIDPDDRDAYIAQLTFSVDEAASNPPSLIIHPVRLTALSKNTDYRPILAEGDARSQILRKIRRYSVNMDHYVP